MIKTLWIYAVSLRRKAYSTYQEREKKKKKLKGRKEKNKGRRVGWGAVHTARAGRGGLFVEHMNPLTCKLLVAMN